VNSENIQDLATQLVAQVTARVLASRVASQNPAAYDPRKVTPRLLTVAQAAEYLGRSENAVKLLFHRGKLPGTKIDNRLQFDRNVLDRLIEDCTFFEVDHRS
jgi:excisionase family DNA binding protein